MAKWLAYLLMVISLFFWLIFTIFIVLLTLSFIYNPFYNEVWVSMILGLLEFAATAYGWGYLRNQIADKTGIRTIRPWLVMIVLTGISIPITIFLTAMIYLVASGGG